MNTKTIAVIVGAVLVATQTNFSMNSRRESRCR